MSTLLEKWRDEAYSKDMNTREGQLYWGAYFAAEKEVYIKLLSNPTEEVKGTVKELADRYDMSVKYMTGFLDGINESLVTPNPIEEMTEEEQIRTIAMDFWASLEHKLRYKQDNNISKKIDMELKACAEVSATLDKRMQKIYNEIYKFD